VEAESGQSSEGPNLAVPLGEINDGRLPPAPARLIAPAVHAVGGDAGSAPSRPSVLDRHNRGFYGVHLT
jgi:hypothetical protein